MTTFAMAGYSKSSMQVLDESSTVMTTPPKEDRSDFKLTGLNEVSKKSSKPSILLVQHKKKIEGCGKVDTKSRIFGSGPGSIGENRSNGMGHKKPVTQDEENRTPNESGSLPQKCNPITGQGFTRDNPKPRTLSNPNARNLASSIF